METRVPLVDSKERPLWMGTHRKELLFLEWIKTEQNLKTGTKTARNQEQYVPFTNINLEQKV